MHPRQLHELRERTLRRSAALLNRGQSPLSELTLFGEISAIWEYVDAYVAFSFDVSASNPQLGVLQVLVRGFPAANVVGTDQYWVSWDRSLYWLDFDGSGPGIPHLLPVLELLSAYQPLGSTPSIVSVKFDSAPFEKLPVLVGPLDRPFRA